MSIEGQKQGRNIEKDKLVFINAIETTSIEETETTFDEAAVAELEMNLRDTKLFILGEVHGVKENVDIIYTLFKKFQFGQIAFEWPRALESVVQTFLKTGEIDFKRIQNEPDGRITAGHFALLQKLVSENLLTSVVCFDSTGMADANARDAHMAKHILAHFSDVPTLVVAGSHHTKTAFNVEYQHHPMGEHLKNSIHDIASGKIEYLSGEFHNIGVKQFFSDPEANSDGVAKFYKNAEDLYIFELPEAHVAVVPNPDERDDEVT